MGLEYRSTRSETAERYYTCTLCGAKAEVMFAAYGDSGWHKEGLFDDDGEARANDAAVEDMMTDADRVLHLIKCPTCERRDGGYVRWAVVRVVAWFALAGLLFAWGGTALLIGVALPVIGGGWQFWRERQRFARADRALLTKLTPGRLEAPEQKALPPPKPILPPAPELPQARAVSVPAIIEPVVVEPRGPDEEPAFLRDKK